MISRCLGRCNSVPQFISPVKHSIRRIQGNINNLIAKLKCDIEEHNNSPITAICLNPECNKYKRIVCVKCMITQEHNDHPQYFVLIEDLLNNQKELDKLLVFLHQYNIGQVDDLDGQIKWLYNAIVQGTQAPYPTNQMEEVLNTFSAEIQNSLLDIKVQFEEEWNQSQKSHSRSSIRTNLNKDRLVQFRNEVNVIIKQSNRLIKEKFSEIFQPENSTKEQKSQDDRFIQINTSVESNKPLNFSQLLQEFPLSPQTMTYQEKIQSLEQQEQNNLVENEEQSVQLTEPNLPCFTFIINKSPKGLFTKGITFQEGGKVINMVPQSQIISNIAFEHGNQEIRLRLKSEQLQRCVHIGLIEQEILQIVRPQLFESGSLWCCLNPNGCSMLPNMQRTAESIGIGQNTVIGLNLNFIDDVVLVKQWTHQNILVLYKKNGYLMKQKQYFFIKSVANVQIELIN